MIRIGTEQIFLMTSNPGKLGTGKESVWVCVGVCDQIGRRAAAMLKRAL